MGKIKNKHYRQFIDNGIITLITHDDLERALTNIKGKNTRQGRSLLIMLYYTGARPVEILRIKGKDVKKEKSYITINVSGSKKGLPRTITLRLAEPHINELWKYCVTIHPDINLFYSFIGKYERKINTKKGETIRIETTDRLRYYIKKWFTGVTEDPIPPYFLRHNLFSSLMTKGATIKDIRFLKGSRTDESVTPYIHMSAKTSQSLAKLLTPTASRKKS